MTESEFNKRVDETFSRIEAALEASGADIDCELAAGGILELEFENGSKIIINRQGAMQEIWVAAKSGGYHYRWQDDGWHDTREGGELFSALGKLVSQQAGSEIVLGQSA